jgi:hypothetical protein
VIFADEFPGADDAAVREISCPVEKAVNRISFEVSPPFRRDDLRRERLAFLAGKRAFLVNEPPVGGQPLLSASPFCGSPAEIKGEKVASVSGLLMMPE